MCLMFVLEVYRITLLSNFVPSLRPLYMSFRGLQNYTTLKLKVVSPKPGDGFRGLQNYTTLKHSIKWVLV